VDVRSSATGLDQRSSASAFSMSSSPTAMNFLFFRRKSVAELVAIRLSQEANSPWPVYYAGNEDPQAME
jgi:hypothetical protein